MEGDVMRTRLLAVAVAGSAVLGGAVTTPVPAAAAAPTVASKGCGHKARTGVSTKHVEVDGKEREYLLSVPKRYSPKKAAPLVFDFHGLGSNMQEQEAYSHLAERGAKDGFVVVTPNASGARLKMWTYPPFPDNDVAFVKKMLRDTQRSLCIDARRVYATGISAGGIMSTSLVCAMPGTFAAIAPVAGVNATKVCANRSPKVSVIAFHGTADPIIPYAGGAYFQGLTGGNATAARTRFTGSLQARPVETAVGEWAAYDGCSKQPSTKSVGSDVELTRYAHCDAHTAVELYTVTGGGHTWPGARSIRTERLGSVTQSIDATKLILDFFRAHPKAR
jgi:polyhydroxybutyrate depolymerase